jgi:hypothetical protein
MMECPPPLPRTTRATSANDTVQPSQLSRHTPDAHAHPNTPVIVALHMLTQCERSVRRGLLSRRLKRTVQGAMAEQC